MTRFLLLLCAAFLLAGCGAKGVTVVDKPGFVTMSQRMPQDMKARGLLTDDGSYISLPGMEGVTEPPRPDSTPRSGLQERSL